MDTKDDYYDVVVARNTITDPKQIYKTLKKDGLKVYAFKNFVFLITKKYLHLQQHLQ